MNVLADRPWSIKPEGLRLAKRSCGKDLSIFKGNASVLNLTGLRWATEKSCGKDL